MTRVLNYNLDASENLFFARELEKIREKSYDILYPGLQGRSLVPVDHSVGRGQETVTFRTMKQFGEASVVDSTGYSNEIPRVDVGLTEQSARVYSVLDGYGYNFQEIRNAMEAKRPLDFLRAKTARDVIERKMDELILVGHSDLSIAGLFNLSGTLSHTVANGTLGTALWADKTSEEIALDMHAICNAVRTNSLRIHEANTLVLPDTAYEYVSQTRMGDGSDKTILDFFKANRKNVTVESSDWLETYADWTGRRMMAYQKDQNILQAVIPQEFEQFKPQERGLETITNCHARYGGIELRYPKAVVYGDTF